MNRAKAHALALLVAACAAAAACGLNQAGVDPPSDTIAYPASAVMDGSGQWLFVTNSNADLRYNDGTLIALSLLRAEEDRNTQGWADCPQVDYANPRSDKIDGRPGEPGGRCCHDVVNGPRGILECDERWYVGPRGSEGNGSYNVRIGSFAAAIVRQDRVCPFVTDSVTHQKAPLCPDACTDLDPMYRGPDRLMIGVRGDTSLTFVDVTRGTADMPPVLDCAAASGDFVACDGDHRIIKTDSFLAAPTDDPNPPQVNLPDEPYALAWDEANGALFIGHLTGNTSRPFTGGFSLFDVMPLGEAPLSSDPPRLIAPFPAPFTPNSLGSVGVSALKPRLDQNGATLGIYASSRYTPQVAPLGVTPTCPQPGRTTREIAAFPTGSLNSPLLGGEMRGIEFVETVEVGPQPTPQGSDCAVGTSPSCDCADQRTGTKVCGVDRVYRGCACGEGAFALQRTPPALIRFDEWTNTPTDILETCSSPTFLDQYDSGVGPRLFVTCFADGEVDVFDPTVPRLVKTFQVGRGPSGLVFDKGRQVAYVVGFGDNNISVIDLAPGSATEYSVIQRIGFPRTSPR